MHIAAHQFKRKSALVEFFHARLPLHNIASNVPPETGGILEVPRIRAGDAALLGVANRHFNAHE